MKIGKVEFDFKEIQWPRKPKEPRFRNPFAHKNCGCVECTDIVKHDAWFFHTDSGLTGQKLVKAVSEQNGRDENESP